MTQAATSTASTARRTRSKANGRPPPGARAAAQTLSVSEPKAIDLSGIAGIMKPGAVTRLDSKPALQAWVSTPIKRKLSLRTPAGKRNNVRVTFQHKSDPRQDLLERIGPLPAGIVQFSRILVAVYQPPVVEKTDAGLFLTPAMQDDDLEEFLWQGKVGLIVAMGAQAYVDDEATRFHGVANRVGDWVWFRPSSGEACDVNGVFCRVFSEGGIYGPIPHPDYVW
jgi:hypothetical protein